MSAILCKQHEQDEHESLYLQSYSPKINKNILLVFFPSLLKMNVCSDNFIDFEFLKTSFTMYDIPNAHCTLHGTVS